MSRQNKVRKASSFRVSLSDAESHENIWGFRFSKPGFVVMVLSVFFVLAAGVFALIAYTPLRNAVPGYPDAHAQRAAVQNAIRIDSLENVISRWEVYSENLVRVMAGEAPLKLDSVIRIAENDAARKDEAYLAAQDSLLRTKVNEAERFELSEGKERALQIQGIHFFPPLKGVVSRAYDPVLHPYVDISAPASSVVMSVLDGTVIFAGWSDDSGYVVGVQHGGDIVSIYRQNEKLLKKAGDKVSAGTPIALAGTDGSLHFELWHKGEVVDPSKYITF